MGIEVGDHTVSIGGRSLILDKNLFFLSVCILNLSYIKLGLSLYNKNKNYA